MKNFLLIVLCSLFLNACQGRSVSDNEKVKFENDSILDFEVKDTLVSNKALFMSNYKKPFFTKGGVVQQEGDSVIVLATDKGSVSFSGFGDTEDGYVYTYLGYDEKSNCFIVKGSVWEGYEFYLIDKKSGIVDTVWNEPYFNENSSVLVCKSMDFGLEGVPNGLQVWKRNQDREWIKIKEIDQLEWVPLRIAWFKNDILVETVSVVDFQSDNISEKTKEYLKIPLD